MNVKGICTVKSCADKSRAVLTIMGNPESGTIGVHIRDDEGDCVLIAISAVDASNMCNEIVKFLTKVVEE